MAEAISRGESYWAQVPWFNWELDFSPYPYSLVLETIYGVHSAANIKWIETAPANMDNTDAGKALQEEIGTKEISDPEEIETLYNIISSMLCMGEDHWELIFPADNGEAPESRLLDRVRLSRYLAIGTDWGEIYSLKYTAVSGCFYEYGGIAGEALSDEDAAVVEAILGIEP